MVSVYRWKAGEYSQWVIFYALVLLESSRAGTSRVCQPYIIPNKFKLPGNFLVAVPRWCICRTGIKTHIFLMWLISLSHNFFLFTGYHRWQPIALSHGNFEVTCMWLQGCVLLCVPLPLACRIGLVSAQWDPSGWLSCPYLMRQWWRLCDQTVTQDGVGLLTSWNRKVSSSKRRNNEKQVLIFNETSCASVDWLTIFVLSSLGICRCDTTTSRPCSL